MKQNAIMLKKHDLEGIMDRETTVIKENPREYYEAAPDEPIDLR